MRDITYRLMECWICWFMILLCVVVIPIEHIEVPPPPTIEPIPEEPIEIIDTIDVRTLVTDEQLEEYRESKMEIPYTDDELYMMAHLIQGEAGSDWCSDELLFYTGSVVLNRVESERFPNTIEEVLYQEGQYGCLNSGYKQEPSDRIWEVAEELLLYGSVLPENVIYQSLAPLGSGIYIKEQNTYFCY